MDNLVNSDKDTELKFSAGKGNSSSVERHSFSQGEEIIEKIPLFAENFDVTKKNRRNTIKLDIKMDDDNKKN
jgi:hypothetical protein